MPWARAAATEWKRTRSPPTSRSPAVLRVEAAQDLDERALAGSVVADEPEHLALAQDEVDAAEDDERAEALRHAAHLERRLCEARTLAHVPLERAISLSNCAFSAIAKMITTPTQT